MILFMRNSRAGGLSCDGDQIIGSGEGRDRLKRGPSHCFREMEMCSTWKRAAFVGLNSLVKLFKLCT